jgi:butyryl-CoA dehydrogenase
MTLRSNHDWGQAALLERARGFVAEEVEPHAARIDREAEFPRDVYRRIAEEGWIGLTRLEGAGATFLEWTLWIEELAAASATVSDVALTSDLLAFILGEFGSGEQRELLGPLLAGETLGAFTLTEPTAGSNAAAIETRAERDDDFYDRLFSGHPVDASGHGHAHRGCAASDPSGSQTS